MNVKTLLLSASLAVACSAAAAPVASAADYVPGQVIVHYADGTSHASAASVGRGADAVGKVSTPRGSTTVRVGRRESVRAAAKRIERRPGVAYARPNYIAHASGLEPGDTGFRPFYPSDPGFVRQWNLTGTYGIDMPDAWELARYAKAPGGRGAVVAVLDTGVAYQRYKRYRRAPDLIHFTKGYDFVDDDTHANDENGHGTHVSGTIAQSTGNGIGAAGIAYRAKIMPVRVLDASGSGDTLTIAKGIRYAASHGADVINMSLEFDSSVQGYQIPDIASALRYAHRKGVVVVGAAGNQADTLVAYPARARYVIGVGATTKSGCQASYSNSGRQVDLVAPGGGNDASNYDDVYDQRTCRPHRSRPFVYQETFTTSVSRFGLPAGYEGTSMAAPHVSGVAALLIATHRLGRHPSPGTIERHLESSARDIGPTGFDERYGHGLLDAAAALTRNPTALASSRAR